MSHLISVEIDNELAQRLLVSLDKVSDGDKDELYFALVEALETDDVEED